MVTKIGQRKFLLKAGYSEESLNEMSPSVAHAIIGDIEKANRKRREKEKQNEINPSDQRVAANIVKFILENEWEYQVAWTLRQVCEQYGLSYDEISKEVNDAKT